MGSGIRVMVMCLTLRKEETQMIVNLKDGMKFVGVALVTTKKEGTTKTGSAYLDLELGDKTATIGCKLWSYDPVLHSFVEAGKVIEVVMAVSTYNGSLQGKIESIKPSALNPQDFVKGSRFDIGRMGKDIMSLADSFEEPLTKALTKELLYTNWSKVELVPAATGMHNNWPGGLLEHAWSLCQIAEPVIAHYKKTYKAKLSRDKVLFGVICHDIGKVLEYDTDGISAKYSPMGVLTPHIVAGIGWIYEKAAAWYKSNKDYLTPEEFARERDQLVHIVASHHGKFEWGSPVVPSTLEAILVHQLDMVDSQFMHALALVEGKQGELQGFSEKSWQNKTTYML